ncbi:hypothetical protein X975_19390, partial [Stegodyphus mimosarum]
MAEYYAGFACLNSTKNTLLLVHTLFISTNDPSS